LFNSQTKRP